jgi:hypothetical protein
VAAPIVARFAPKALLVIVPLSLVALQRLNALAAFLFVDPAMALHDFNDKPTAFRGEVISCGMSLAYSLMATSESKRGSALI